MVGTSMVYVVCRTCIFLLSSKISMGLVASFLSSNTLLIAWYHVCTMVR